MDSILFTPASLIDLLSKVDELSDLEIGISETLDGGLQLTVGQSTYMIDTSDAREVEVDDSVVQEVEETNLQTYESLDDSVDVEMSDTPIESGILKELAKSLLLGGLIRLSAKLAK